MQKFSSLFPSPQYEDETATSPEMLNSLTRPRPPAFMFSEAHTYDLGMDEIRLDGHLDDQLPSPEEAKVYGLVPRVPLFAKRWFRLTCVGLVCIIIISAVSSAIIYKKRNIRGQPAAQLETEGIDLATVDIGIVDKSQDQGVIVDNRLRTTIKFLLNNANHKMLTNTSSPQFLAAQWIAEVDSLQAPLTEESGVLERYALAVLWFATKGESWKQSVNFMTESHHCEWRDKFQREDLSYFEMGVHCNEQAKVKSIILQNLDLKGSLPVDLTLLSSLNRLSLDDNELWDFESVRPLTQVTQMTLGYNQFMHTIPTWINELSDLKVLGLSGNNFTSTLPSQFADLLNLEILALDDNNLSGDLHVVERMALLKQVYLEDNHFTGTVTNDFLRQLVHLEHLDVSNNRLEGTIGMSLFQRLRLEVVDIHGNNLGGQLPNIPHIPSLRYLSLNDNFFEGAIPSTLTHLSSLQHFDVSNNRLSGPLPDFNALTNLEYLFLAQNHVFVQGPVPDLRRLTNLKELSFRETARTGPIPEWIADLDQLQLLDLGNNRHNSTIPSTLSKLTNLIMLFVNRNEIEGKIPAELASMEALSILLLDENYLTGDTDHMCPLKLSVMIADCAEIRCDCCSLCCKDEKHCSDQHWLTNYESIWSKKYPRDVYQSNNDIIIIPQK